MAITEKAEDYKRFSSFMTHNMSFTRSAEAQYTIVVYYTGNTGIYRKVKHFFRFSAVPGSIVTLVAQDHFFSIKPTHKI